MKLIREGFLEWRPNFKGSRGFQLEDVFVEVLKKRLIIGQCVYGYVFD